jgi:hypothetical protein
MLKVSPPRLVADHTTVAKSHLAPSQPQLHGLQNAQSAINMVQISSFNIVWSVKME